MNELDLLLALAALAIPASALFATTVPGRWLLVAVYAVELGLLLALHPERATGSALSFELLGNRVGWQLDALGWFFAVITVGAAGFSAAFAAGEWSEVNASAGSVPVWH